MAYVMPGFPKKYPVHFYKKYAKKRPLEMMDPECLFFLTVANQLPEPDQAWFKNS